MSPSPPVPPSAAPASPSSSPAPSSSGGNTPPTVAAQMAMAVQVAFSLGWTIADIYEQGLPAQGRRSPDPPPPDEGLPGIGTLIPSQRALLRLDQIDAALSSLSSLIEHRGLHVPTTRDIRTAQQAEAPKAEKRKAIYALHILLLRRLTAVDYRLGKAYGLGRALAETCHKPHSRAEMAERFGHHRLDNLRGWLNDLASSLPDHSAKAVLSGLTRWEAWVANLCAKSVDEEEWAHIFKPVHTTLRRQGQMWRSLLSDEKDARDTLSMDSYLKAADTMSQRALALAWKFLRRPGLAVPLLLLTVAAIGLLVWGVTGGGAAQVTAGIASAAAALGITWKTVGGAAQKLGEAIEKPLWGAEIDTAVGEALTYLPLTPVSEPRPDILLDAPVLLREISAAQDLAPSQPQDIPTDEGTNAEDPKDEQMRKEREYLRNWALVSGYIEVITDEQGTEHERVSHEGRRLAEIPPGEHGNVRAVLGAGRGVGSPTDDTQDDPATTTASASDGEETR